MLIAVGTVPEPSLASNVIVAGARAGIVTVADAVTAAPVQEPFDDFTAPFIVVVVDVAPLLKVFVLVLNYMFKLIIIMLKKKH